MKRLAPATMLFAALLWAAPAAAAWNATLRSSNTILTDSSFDFVAHNDYVPMVGVNAGADIWRGLSLELDYEFGRRGDTVFKSIAARAAHRYHSGSARQDQRRHRPGRQEHQKHHSPDRV